MAARTMIKVTFLLPVILFTASLFAVLSIIVSSGSWDGISHVLSNQIYLDVIWNTFEIASVTGLISTIIGFVLAFMIGGLNKKAQVVVVMAITIPALVPTLSRVFGILVLLQQNGFITWISGVNLFENIQGRFTVVAALCHAYLPMAFVLSLASLKRIPTAQLKAASTLGAPVATIFRKIVLPQIAVAMMSVFLFLTLLTMGVYVTPSLLGGSREIMLYKVIETRLNYALDIDLASSLSAVVVFVLLTILLLGEYFLNLSKSVLQR